MAAALVDYAHSNDVEPKPENVREFQILPGEGIYGEIDGKSIYIGNKRIAARAGCETGTHRFTLQVKEKKCPGSHAFKTVIVGKLWCLLFMAASYPPLGDDGSNYHFY